MPKIRGRIIRIVDARTVVINLGSEHGITGTSIFSILGKAEAVVDPFSGEELGRLVVVKAKVRASQVYEKFTMATTRWRTWSYASLPVRSDLFGSEEVDEGELFVLTNELQPWKAKSEEPVSVGDEVEVEVAEEPGDEVEAEGDTGQEVSEERDELEGDSGDSVGGHG